MAKGDAISKYDAKMINLKAENKQLKEALGKISEGHPDGNPIFLIEIAQQALKGTQWPENKSKLK